MFEKFKNYFRGPAVATKYNVVPVPQGNRVTVDAKGNVVFATCMEILAKNVAETTWGIYGNDYKEIKNQMINTNPVLNYRPYEGINAYNFWYYIEMQRNANGNGVAYLKFDNTGSYIESMVPLDSAYVTVYWDDANILEGARKFYYEYRDPVSKETYTMLPEEVFHVMSHSVNGIVGRPSLLVLLETLKENAEIKGAMRTSIQNGFSGTIALQYTSDLNVSQRKEVQNQIKELMDNSNSLYLPLPVGMSATNIKNDICQQYSVLKNADVEEISSLFGVPLAMLNVGSGTGAGVFATSQLTWFREMTMKPILKQYAKELSVKLLTRKQIKAGIKFDTADDAFDYLDPQAKASVLSAYTGAGILTANESRCSIGYPKSSDPNADLLTQRGGTGALGDSAENEGGNTKNDEGEN